MKPVAWRNTTESIFWKKGASWFHDLRERSGLLAAVGLGARDSWIIRVIGCRLTFKNVNLLTLSPVFGRLTQIPKFKSVITNLKREYWKPVGRFSSHKIIFLNLSSRFRASSNFGHVHRFLAFLFYFFHLFFFLLRCYVGELCWHGERTYHLKCRLSVIT